MPPGDKIRVVIVDDVSETRENVRKLLQFESDVDVVGLARTGKEAIQISQELNPDVVLMDTGRRTRFSHQAADGR